MKILQGTDTWLPSAFQKSMMLGSVGSAGQKPCTMQGRKPNSVSEEAIALCALLAFLIFELI